MLEAIYREMRGLFSAEQTTYLLMWAVFVRYLKREEPKTEKCKLFYYQKEKDFLRNLDSYDFKLALCRLEDLIDFDFIQVSYEEAEKKLDWLERQAVNWNFTSAEEVNRWVARLLTVAEGEFGSIPTPVPVKQMLVKLAQTWEFGSVAEICCGTSGIGIDLLGRSHSTKKLPRYYGEDIRPFCSICAAILLWINGIRDFSVATRDSLAFKKDGEQYGLVLADIPVGANESRQVDPEDDRFPKGTGKSVYTDWIFLEEMLYRMAPGGRGAAIVTKGAAVRKNEAILRQYVTEQDWLEAVVTLPQNLYPGDKQGRELLVFHKGKRDRRGLVAFIDLKDFCSRENSGPVQEEMERLAENGLREPERSYGKGYGQLVSTARIRENLYTWNPMFYLTDEPSDGEAKETISLGEAAQVTRGLQLAKRDEEMLSDDGTHYLLNIKNIEDGSINYEDCKKIRWKNAQWIHKYQIREDDILLTSKGTQLKMAMVPPNPPPAFISGNLTIIRTDRATYHPYVLYEYLRSPEGRRWLERYQTGSTIRVLNASSLMQIKVPRYKKTLMETAGKELKENDRRYREAVEQLASDYKSARLRALEMLKGENDYA